MSMTFIFKPAVSQISERLNEEGKPIIISNSKRSIIPGEVIVKFKNGFLDSAEIESDYSEFDIDSRIVKKNDLKLKLKGKSVSKLRKIVRKNKTSS
jgi:hypothetical protein